MTKKRYNGTGHWPHATTARMVELYRTTLPLLVALRDVARPQAARRGERPVSPAVVVEARAVLADARRVLAREPVSQLLHLRELPAWAALHAKLELALAGFASFRDTKSYVDRDWGHTWRDEAWLSLTYGKPKSLNDTNGLQESSENLST